jgi:hypothetical protein
MQEASARRDEPTSGVRSLLSAGGYYPRPSRPIRASRYMGRTWPRPSTSGRLGWRDAPVHFFLTQFQVRNLTDGTA